LRKFFQFRLRQFAVGDDTTQMIAHLVDDIDRENQFLARTAFPIRVWVRRRKFNYCTRLPRYRIGVSPLGGHAGGVGSCPGVLLASEASE
jgi:hypothetical protein